MSNFSPVKATHQELVREYYKQREDLSQALEAGQTLAKTLLEANEKIKELEAKLDEFRTKGA